MTDLRVAAQQALEALKLSTPDDYAEQGWKEHNATITALRAALAEPVECQHGVTDGNCKECYEAKAEPVQEPVAWYHIPHPGNGISPVVSMFQQREPSLYGAVVPLYTVPPRCPNCASLEEQNTELDRKLAELTEAVLRANGIGGK